MRRVSDIDVGLLRDLSEITPGDKREIPNGPDGMPADRTICSWCLGQDENCSTCTDGVVCPYCRGGRVLSIAPAERPRYKACSHCTDWDDQERHTFGGKDGLGNPRPYNWPVYQRSSRREAAAVAYYRRTKRDADILAARGELPIDRQAS